MLPSLLLKPRATIGPSKGRYPQTVTGSQLVYQEVSTGFLEVVQLEDARSRENGLDIILGDSDITRVEETKNGFKCIWAQSLEVHYTLTAFTHARQEHCLEIWTASDKNNLVGVKFLPLQPQYNITQFMPSS